MPDSRTLWTAVVIICIAVSVFFSVKKRTTFKRLQQLMAASAERRHKRKHSDKKDTDTKRNWFAGAIGKKGKKDKKDKKGRKDKKSGRKAARKGKGSKSRRGKKKKK